MDAMRECVMGTYGITYMTSLLTLLLIGAVFAVL
jgi:hypothetical protein